MKQLISLLLIISMLSCNSQAATDKGASTDTTVINNPGKSATTETGDCATGLLFKQGAEISSSSYDAQGQEVASQVSTIGKVYTDNGKLISEVAMKNKGKNGADAKTMNAIYTCDGEYLKMDLSFMLPQSGQKGEISSPGILFPRTVSEGQTLPDATYSVDMKSGQRSMKITTNIKERKVEAKEQVITTAGTFQAYRISSVVEAMTEIPGMDEQSKKIMEEAMKKAGKNRMIFWYVPDLTIIKMEFYMGDKLVTKSVVTGIKK